MACCKASGLWKTIAAFSMILSCLYLGASICGLLTYHCIFSPTVSKFQVDNFYLTYVLYFYNYECIDLDSNFIVFNPDPSERTWGFMIAYITVNAVWFFTSVLLLRAPNHWQTGTSKFMTYPWLLCTFAVLTLDLISAIIYGLDLQDIWDLPSLANFIGVSYPKLMEDSQYFTYVPAATIIMVTLFAKFFIGWLLLLICLIFIFFSLNRVSQAGSELILQTRPYENHYAPPAYNNPAFDMSETRRSPQIQPTSEEMLWSQNIGHVPQILPRAKLDNQWIMTSPEENDNQNVSPGSPGRPKSILKSPNPTYQTNLNQQPWSYLPQSFNRQLRLQRESSESWNPQPSAPPVHQRSRETLQAMYY